jgi:hypothetical protein
VELSWSLAGSAAAGLLERSRLIDEETGAIVEPSSISTTTIAMVAPTHRLTWRVNSLPWIEAGADRTCCPGQSLVLVASFGDEDPDDTHSATVDWGDGTVEPGQVSAATSTVTSPHTYDRPGGYVVRACIDDGWAEPRCDELVIQVSATCAPLFSDGFNSGATGAWSATSSD